MPLGFGFPTAERLAQLQQINEDAKELAKLICEDFHKQCVDRLLPREIFLVQAIAYCVVFWVEARLS